MINVPTVTATLAILGHKRGTYDTLMEKTLNVEPVHTGTNELIVFELAPKIAKVFGDYSSLEVRVGLHFNGDPKNLKAEIAVYKDAMLAEIVDSVNDIVKAFQSGVKI